MNAKEKKLLEEKIYRILKESMYEEFMGEEGNSDAEEQMDDIGVNSSRISQDDGRRNKRASKEKEHEVIQWLKDDQENNAAVARELWPEKDEDAARSEFSKKVRGKDASGKPYSFDAKDVNRLYNIKNRFINKIDESKLAEMISESIKKRLNEGIAHYALLDELRNIGCFAVGPRRFGGQQNELGVACEYKYLYDDPKIMNQSIDSIMHKYGYVFDGYDGERNSIRVYHK